MPTLYKDKVAALSRAFKDDRHDRDAFETIRSLLDTVILTPTEEGFTFDIQGELAQILALTSTGKHTSAASTKPLKTTKPSQFTLEGSEELAQQVKLVAGVGLVSLPFGLPRHSAFASYEPCNLRFRRILRAIKA